MNFWRPSLVLAGAIAAIASARAADLTRDMALDRLLAGTGIAVEWQDQRLATAPVSVTTDIDAILAGTSYVLVHGGENGAITRIIVTGAATGRAPPPLSLLAPVRAGSAASRDEAGTARRRAAARDLAIKRKQADNEALRRKLAELPPGTHILRNQAVRFSAVRPAGQLGNIPIFVAPRDLPLGRRQGP